MVLTVLNYGGACVKIEPQVLINYGVTVSWRVSKPQYAAETNKGILCLLFVQWFGKFKVSQQLKDNHIHRLVCVIDC